MRPCISRKRSACLFILFGSVILVLTLKLDLSGPFNYTPVILLTYYRSGSSLTGEVMQQHQDAFYVFEPLQTIKIMTMRHASISYMDGSVWSYGQYNKTLVAESVVEGWLTCNLSLINLESFFNGFMKYGNKTNPALNCFKTNYVRKADNFTIRRMLPCLHTLQTECSKSKYRIIKTIRLRIDEAVKITRKLPNLKVIHLVRDPRGIVESRRGRGRCKATDDGVSGCAKSLCADMKRDIDAKPKIASCLPDRLYTVQYENMANFPIQTSNSLYQFIGIPFIQSIQDYIVNITRGSNTAGCKVCQQHWQIGRAHAPNASQHISKWKDAWTREQIDSTQLICSNVIRYYNYTFF